MKEKTKEKISKSLRGSKSPRWKGGSKSTDGENARRAWEKHWGKKIPDGFVVDHKDGNPTNNSPSNLRIMSRAKHNTVHKKGKTWAEWKHQTKNKPNKPEKQRRYR
jgi:hypothetical protein